MFSSRIFLPALILLSFTLEIYGQANKTLKEASPNFIQQIKIGMGEITQTEKVKASRQSSSNNQMENAATHHPAIAEDIKVTILKVLRDLDDTGKYDFQIARNPAKADFRVNGVYTIESQAKSSFRQVEKQQLSLNLINNDNKSVGRFTVDSEKNFLRDKQELIIPVSKILAFLIQTRICTHTRVLEIPKVFNSNQESVVLKTEFKLPKEKQRQKKNTIDTYKVNTLLTNMFVNVQNRQPSTAKSFNFRILDQSNPLIKLNDIVVKALFSQKDAKTYLLKLTFNKGGQEFFRDKELELDAKRIQEGDYTEFITKVYPQIGYLRSHNF